MESQLAKLRREASVIAKVKRDQVDDRLEGSAQRISCSMIWNASSYDL